MRLVKEDLEDILRSRPMEEIQKNITGKEGLRFLAKKFNMQQSLDFLFKHADIDDLYRLSQYMVECVMDGAGFVYRGHRHSEEEEEWEERFDQFTRTVEQYTSKYIDYSEIHNTMDIIDVIDLQGEDEYMGFISELSMMLTYDLHWATRWDMMDEFFNERLMDDPNKEDILKKIIMDEL